MKKKLVFISIISLISFFKIFSLFAQENYNENSSEYYDDFQEYIKNVDSLISEWLEQYSSIAQDLDVKELNEETDFYPFFSEEVIKVQLDRMNTYIEMTYNNIVKNYIYFYAYKKRKFVSYLLGLSKYYFPYFEEALDRYGLPLELKYLPIIESALNPRAISRAKAVGLWQFILSTAKMYNLNVNSFIDERMCPYKSSDAAARYLRDLYNIFNDWHLVLAAYNCGPMCVQKAIMRSGKKSYWSIYNYLPKETRGYVPAFIAAAYTFHYANELKIKPKELNLPLYVDTVYVKNWLHFKQISEVLNLDYDIIKFLNPQYKKDIVPASPDNKMYLILPVNSIISFLNLEDSIYKYNDSIFFAHIRPSKFKNIPIINEKAIIHTVKTGETLYSIAKKYNVSVSNIKEWNNLKSHKIKPKTKLIIFKPNNKSLSKNNLSNYPAFSYVFSCSDNNKNIQIVKIPPLTKDTLNYYETNYFNKFF